MSISSIFFPFTSNKDEKSKTPYFVNAFIAFFVVGFILWIWPKAVPFKMFHFWETKGSVVDWFTTFSPFFLWVGVLSVVMFTFKRDKITWVDLKTLQIKDIFKGGFFISLWAGVVEEISFRWLLFFSAIITAKISNFFLFGFMSQGIVAWLHLNVVGAFADLTTLGIIHDVLYHPATWAVGAGALTANATFRDGHAYQGIIGWLDSWFFGIGMFYILFKYGLVACIALHFAVDMFLFSLLAVMVAVEKAQRKAW